MKPREGKGGETERAPKAPVVRDEPAFFPKTCKEVQKRGDEANVDLRCGMGVSLASLRRQLAAIEETVTLLRTDRSIPDPAVVVRSALSSERDRALLDAISATIKSVGYPGSTLPGEPEMPEPPQPAVVHETPSPPPCEPLPPRPVADPFADDTFDARPTRNLVG
jgi:hypothetical protein